jgi:hypothetical protein
MVDGFITAKTLSVVSLRKNLENLKGIKLPLKKKRPSSESLVPVKTADKPPFPFSEGFHLLDNITIRKSLLHLKNTAEQIGITDWIEVDE